MGPGPDSLFLSSELSPNCLLLTLLQLNNQKELGNVPLGGTRRAIWQLSFNYSNSVFPLWDVTQDDFLSPPKL